MVRKRSGCVGSAQVSIEVILFDSSSIGVSRLMAVQVVLAQSL